MDGPELLSLLLAKRGLTPNALADTLRQRSLQSQMQRYLARETKSPRPETLAPIARFFGIGIEAFYQPSIARDVAERLELLPRTELASATSSTPPATPQSATAPTPIRPKARVNIAEMIEQLGICLQPYDESARRAVATLLQDVALHPETAKVAGQRIAAMLDVPGNAPQGRSTNSG